MRKRMHEQLPLMQPFISHDHGRELAEMDAILDNLRDVLSAVQRDLAGRTSPRRGREGMTAEQVLRVLIIKQLNGYTYDELSFHLCDSTCYRAFCRMGILDKAPSRSTLQENIKRLQPKTMEKIQLALVKHAQEIGMEDGERLRIDCTTTECNIHEPTDSSLLWDVTRKLTTLMKRGRMHGITFHDRRRRAKRRWVAIQYAGTMERRAPIYRELIALAGTTCEEALQAAALLEKRAAKMASVQKLAVELREYAALGRRVIDQAQGRVLEQENVPAAEKVVSIFEPHTDIIVKGRRSTEYGHKICLATGRSGLITDCVVQAGNPADVTLAPEMIDRHRAHFGAVPREAAFDGGFASRQNLATLKERGVKEVMFSKLCGLEMSDLTSSLSVYRALRHFRAGVEASISFLKRVVGLERCTWRGQVSFGVYVLSSVVTANLLLLARHRLAT